MRLKNSVLALIIVLLFSSSLFGDEPGTENAKSPDVEKIEKVVLLPFYDYSDSGMKYLSDYIPELLKNNMSVDMRIKLLDPDDIRDELEKSGLTAKNLYDTETAIKFLNDIGADAGIKGRYIIHGKTVKIDIKAIYPRSGKRLNGPTYEGVVDDNFLASLEKFAISRDVWFKNYVLMKTLTSFEEKDYKAFKSIKERVKKSKLGIILTNKWLLSLMIIIFFFLIARIVVLFFEKVLKKITRKTSTNVDEDIIDFSKKPVKWLVIVIGFKFVVVTLNLSTSLTLFLNNLVIASIIFIITHIVSRSLDIIIRSWGHKIASKIDSRIDDDLVPLFVNITKVVVLSTGVLMVLSRFNIDIAPFIASLGVAGFAIGFAVKDTLSNIIGGIVLILDSSFAVGDKVTIDGDTGIIKEVGLRNTKLATFDNEIIVMPNGDLMNKKFKNSVLPDPTIRVVVNFGVAYGSDVDHVQKVVLDAITKLDDISNDPEPAVVFTEMADFALNFQAKLWVPDYVNQYGKKLEATKAVYNALNEANIEIPFPTHTVYIEKEGE